MTKSHKLFIYELTLGLKFKFLHCIVNYRKESASIYVLKTTSFSIKLRKSPVSDNDNP